MPTEVDGRPKVDRDRRAKESADVGPRLDLSRLRDVKPRDLLIRFVFGAGVSVGAAVIAKVFSARFGGLFLAFPAILPASLTLLEEKESTRRADRNAVGAVLGGLAMVAFAAVGETQFTRLHPAIVLSASLASWIALSCVLYATLALLRPGDCDRNED